MAFQRKLESGHNTKGDEIALCNRVLVQAVIGKSAADGVESSFRCKQAKPV